MRPNRVAKTSKPHDHRCRARRRCRCWHRSRYLNGQPIRRANREQIEQAILSSSATSAMRLPPRSARTSPISFGFLVPRFDEFHAQMLGALKQFVRRSGPGGAGIVTGAIRASLPKRWISFRPACRCHRHDGTADVYDRVDELLSQNTPIIFYQQRPARARGGQGDGRQSRASYPHCQPPCRSRPRKNRHPDGRSSQFVGA